MCQPTAAMGLSSGRNLFAEPQSGDRTYLSLQDHEVDFLLETYRRRVDPVVKVLDAASFEAEVKSQRMSRGSPRRDLHFDALQAGVFYSCFCSLGEVDCEKHFRSSKARLQQAWRVDVERRLAACNFLLSDSLELLQTLILYLVPSLD